MIARTEARTYIVNPSTAFTMDVVITLTLVMTPVGYIIPVITSLKFGMNFKVTLFLAIKGEARLLV